jgi:DNA repair protein RecN (Recombination protein N)
VLEKLYIKNYVIIDEISISFDQHLNVITGETGAGKSIILGAISLILGERAESSVLINKVEKCIVEAQFDTRNNTDFELLLKANDLDSEHPTIIRREISTSGKSRAFINDTPVTLSILNSLTACLVDLHRQFDNRALDESRFMFQSLDAIAGIQQQVKNYQTEFERFKQIQKEYVQLNQQQAQWQKEADYNNFLFEELEAANFQEGEIEILEQQIQQLGHAELIQNSLSEAHHLLAENELAIVLQIRKIGQNLQQIGKYLPTADELAKRIGSCYEELKDIASECANLKEEVELDPAQLVQLQERYDLGNRLLKKHTVSTTNELRAIHEKLAAWQLQHSNADTNLSAIKQRLEQQENLLAQLSQEIARNREQAAPKFSNEINKLLHLVGMPNAVFNVSLAAAAQFNNYGKQDIQFLLDANKSGRMQVVQKAASGGELSRIMLSIKTLTAKALHMPTLIFDEVDTGISGEAAKQVGILLRSLGDYHQILCITHQPQVAGKGHRHLYVYKTSEAEQVNTRIKELSLEERIQLIASMIGGAEPSEAALNNARELVTA